MCIITVYWADRLATHSTQNQKACQLPATQPRSLGRRAAAFASIIGGLCNSIFSPQKPFRALERSEKNLSIGKVRHCTRNPFSLYFFRRKDFFFCGRKGRRFFSGGRFSCESVQNSKESFGEVGKKSSPKLSDRKINLSAETSPQENLPAEKNLFKTLARKFSDLSSTLN